MAPGAAPPSGDRPFDRFNHRAKLVLALAQDEAMRFNHDYLGTEHLLLGLRREGEGMAARVLSSLGIELPSLRTALETVVGRTAGAGRRDSGEMALTPGARKVIQLALLTAKTAGHQRIDTEHILLALVRERDAVAIRILEALGASVDRVEQKLAKMLGADGSGSEATRL